MNAQPNKPEPPGKTDAHVTVEDGEQVRETAVPATPTPLPDLVSELGLAGDLVLWLRRHGERLVVDIHALFTPESGDRFIAVRGGGVS